MSPISVVSVDQFTDQEGETVRHLVGMRCWCHGNDGQPDPNCKNHEAGGWIYVDEKQITGLVTAITHHKELIAAGVLETGECVFSPRSDYTVSEGDKIIFTWALPFGPGEPLKRGGGNSEPLYYEAAKSIYCIDENKVKYIEGTDFRFNGKTIEWKWTGKTGATPALGIRYTVKYMAFIEWIAFVPPITRISHGEDIGSKVILRKKHLVG